MRPGPRLLACAALGACTVQPAATHPRPPLPLPDAVASRYRLPGEVAEVQLVPIGRGDRRTYHRGRLRSGDEEAVFQLVLPDGDRPAPLVLCLPILAGGEDLMWVVAEDLAGRGYAAAWARRVSSALRPGQRGRDLETLLRRTIVHNRMLLAWARRQPELDPQRQALLGISLGGMIGAGLMAAEPTLRAGALCISGGDLADLVLVSSEPRVRRWRRWRAAADALADRELFAEFDASIASDPARLGPYVGADRVLLVAAALDSVIPPRNQNLLWESLGRPQRLHLPLSHYSAVLALGSVLDAIDAFYRHRGVAPGAADATRAREPQTPGA